MKQVEKLEEFSFQIFWQCGEPPNDKKTVQYVPVIKDLEAIARSLIERVREAEEVINNAQEPSLSYDTQEKAKAYLEKYK